MQLFFNEGYRFFDDFGQFVKEYVAVRSDPDYYMSNHHFFSVDRAYDIFHGFTGRDRCGT